VAGDYHIGCFVGDSVINSNRWVAFHSTRRRRGPIYVEDGGRGGTLGDSADSKRALSQEKTFFWMAHPRRWLEQSFFSGSPQSSTPCNALSMSALISKCSRGVFKQPGLAGVDDHEHAQ
jgi:hypothetical protein